MTSARCPHCNCTRPGCADGCTYTWRERIAWWASRSFRRQIRRCLWPPHQHGHEIELEAWRSFLESQGIPFIPKYRCEDLRMHENPK